MAPVAVRSSALVWIALFALGCGNAASEADNERALGRLGADDGAADGEVDGGLDGDEPSDSSSSDTDGSQARDALPTGCTLTDEDRAIVAETFVSPDDGLALTVRNEGALLTWVAYQGGAAQVTPMWFAADASSVAGVILAGATEQREPASTTTQDGFLSVWSDREHGRFELYAHGVSAKGAQADDSVRLTDDASDDRHPVATMGADGRVLVAWQSSQARSVRGKVMLLGADGTRIGAARDVPGFGALVGRPALASHGDGYVLSWVDASTRRVAVQVFDEAGAPVGESGALAAERNAAGRVDLATSEAGGAVAFDVRVAGERAEVHVHMLDESGAPTGIEQTLTEHPETGLSPSIAAFRGGYAVAYRSEADTQRSLRVAFVNARGEKVAATAIAGLHALDVPTTLRVSPDGRQIFVAWTDAVEATGAYELRRASIRCE